MADEYGIAPNIFGPIDPRLPALIGRLVMLSAVLEHSVAVMAMSVQDLSQNHYLAQDVSRNLEVCNRRFPYFRAPWQIEATSKARPYLKKIKAVLGERNEIVHRVWAVAFGDVWGGHKGNRTRSETADEKATNLGWHYTPERFQKIIDQMVSLIDEGHAIIPSVVGLPRLPSPYANGVWPHPTEA